jgi:hypothetical protein
MLKKLLAVAGLAWKDDFEEAPLGYLPLPRTMPLYLSDGAFCVDCRLYIQLRLDGSCLHCGSSSIVWMKRESVA